ncbi:MAG: hypothetical protein ACJA0N_001318, partial [Pseudohongiellaceae bacterium]
MILVFILLMAARALLYDTFRMIYLGKALTYSLNQWPKLIRYLEDGELNIDNNRAER